LQIPETPGIAVSAVQYTVPADAPAGHYVLSAECDEAAPDSSAVVYYGALFTVTGGPSLPTLTVSPGTGPPGTHVDVSGACAPSEGQDSAVFSVAILSATDPSVVWTDFNEGLGPVQLVTLPIPAGFTPGAYFVAASCSDYVNETTFAEHSFIVTPFYPAPPGSVTAKPGSTRSGTTGPIIVSFTTPSNHGYAISGYTATCRSSNGGTTRTGVHNGATAAPITVANATLKKTYACTVTATNNKGTSHASAASNAVVVGAPAQVAKPSISKPSSGHLKVTFTNLTTAGANGSALTTPDYTATCSSSNGGAKKSATGTGSPITVAGLTGGKSYTCTVMAHNARGYGEASTPSSAHTA
jgi:hypothetical protein